MQGAEIEYDGSVLKYMTKSEIEEQRSSLLIMTQRLFCAPMGLCNHRARRPCSACIFPVYSYLVNAFAEINNTNSVAAI